MKFTCSRQDLLDAATNVQRAVSTKSNIPALEGILIKAQGETLSLSGYDLEIGITTSIPAVIEEEDELIVSARLFGDIIRKLNSDTVCLSGDATNVITIQGGNAEFSIPVSPASEFPEIPAVTDGKSLTLPRDLLSSMIRQTLFAVAQNENKPIHTGSLFETGEGMLRIVSLDGYRLALRQEPIQAEENFHFVVPGKTLGEVLKLLSANDEEEEVSLSVGNRHIIFTIGTYSVISRLLDGEFLNYRQSIPKGNTTLVNVKVREFIDSLDRASLLINDRLKSPVRCVFENDEIKISCATTIGRIRDEIGAQLTGDSVEMGFNNKYLMDALRAAESDEVRIELNGPVSPMKIYPPQGEDFLFLVLPVRLKNEI